MQYSPYVGKSARTFFVVLCALLRLKPCVCRMKLLWKVGPQRCVMLFNSQAYSGVGRLLASGRVPGCFGWENRDVAQHALSIHCLAEGLPCAASK